MRPVGPTPGAHAGSRDPHAVKPDAEPRSSRRGALSYPPAPPRAMTFSSAVLHELVRYISEPNALAILSACATISRVPVERLSPAHMPVLLSQVRASFSFFGVTHERRDLCLARLLALSWPAEGFLVDAAVTIDIEREHDVVRARGAGRAVCEGLGFSEVGGVKVATAISELARNILHYATRGTVTLQPLAGPPPAIEVIARDHGPGIADLAAVLQPGYRSRTGMGAGLRGTRALMDSFEVVTSPGQGTVVTIRKQRS